MDNLGYQLRTRHPCYHYRWVIWSQTCTIKSISHALFDPPNPHRPHVLFHHPLLPPADDMPALFARSFLFTSDAAGVPRSSPFSSLALPTAWFRRIAATLRPTNNSATGHRGTRHGKNTFISQSR